jgi:hypothetical protein
MLHTCQICGRPFNGHPSARNCSLSCVQRGKHQRRKQREHSFYVPTPPESPYAFIYTDISPDILSQVYSDIQTHIYDRDIRINGALPTGIPCPPDVILENLGDHYVAYHKSRQLIL